MSLKSKIPFPVNEFGGINKNYSDGDIKDSQSPDCLNCITFELGSKETRPGLQKLFDTLGAGNVNGLFYFDNMILAHGTKLYKWDGASVTELYSGLTDTDIRAIEFEDCLYLINKNEYIKYDGTTASAVVAYNPTTEEQNDPGQNELSTAPDSITKNKWISVYTNRIVMAEDNTLWFSHRYKPDYFPSPQFLWIGSKREKITGIRPFYNYLTVLKENSIWAIVGNLTNNPQDFEVRPITDGIGCISGDTIALVDNKLIFLANDGVRALSGSTVKEYLNTQKISMNIDKLLNEHSEVDKKSAMAILWRDYYILAIGSATYILDTRTMEWDIWDNIDSNCYLTVENELYIGDKTEGIINKLTPGAYNDNGNAINAYWKSKRFYITRAEEIKKFYAVRINFEISAIRSNNSVSVLIDDEVYSEEIVNIQKFVIGESVIGEGIITPRDRMTGEIDLSEKGSYIQIEIKNNNLDEKFKIFDYTFYYKRKKVN